MGDIYKKRNYICIGSENHRFSDFRWESEGLPSCPECGGEVELYYGRNFFGEAPAVAGDECDVWIRHGICNEDGTPKNYRSKSEIRRAAQAAGWTLYGETPKLTPKQQEEKAEWQEKTNKKWS